MIQRIQTVVLFLAAVLNFSILFLPIADASSNESMESGSVKFYGSRLEVESLNEAAFKFETMSVPLTSEPLLLGHVIAVGAVSLVLMVAIFLYSHRPRQVMLGYVGLVGIMVQVILATLIYKKLPQMVAAQEGDPHNLGIFFFVPAVALLLTWYAIKRIQRDEKLVKGMDRIR